MTTTLTSAPLDTLTIGNTFKIRNKKHMCFLTEQHTRGASSSPGSLCCLPLNITDVRYLESANADDDMVEDLEAEDVIKEEEVTRIEPAKKETGYWFWIILLIVCILFLFGVWRWWKHTQRVLPHIY